MISSNKDRSEIEDFVDDEKEDSYDLDRFL